MSQRNEHIDLVMEELQRYGLRGEIGDRGKHLEIAFETPMGRRFVIVARTPSDWRAGLNTRSDLRRILKADNMQPKVISQFTFQKAMSLPKATAVAPELVLQADVNELVDLVFELQSQMVVLREQNQFLQDRMNSARVVSRIEFGELSSADGVAVEIEKKFYDKNLPFRGSSTQGKIFACLTFQYKSIYDVVEESGIPMKYVATTLSKAKKRGFAEFGLRGQWRRKQ